jgi:hypothetical protein
MIDKNYAREILKTALEARVREVTEYQVNITNFSLALLQIGDDTELAEFKAQLEGLLSSSYVEQKKAMIMLEVIQAQLKD